MTGMSSTGGQFTQELTSKRLKEREDDHDQSRDTKGEYPWRSEYPNIGDYRHKAAKQGVGSVTGMSQTARSALGILSGGEGWCEPDDWDTRKVKTTLADTDKDREDGDVDLGPTEEELDRYSVPNEDLLSDIKVLPRPKLQAKKPKAKKT